MNGALKIFFLIGWAALLAPHPGMAQLSTNKKKAIELYAQADNFRVRGQYNAAISLLQEAIGKDRNFVEAYFRLGITFKAMRDFNRANLSLEQGLSIARDPKKQKGFFLELGDNYLRDRKSVV